MLITLLAFTIFFISLNFEIFESLSENYVFILLGNILNLIASVIFFYYFYKSKFQKKFNFLMKKILIIFLSTSGKYHYFEVAKIL